MVHVRGESRPALFPVQISRDYCVHGSAIDAPPPDYQKHVNEKRKVLMKCQEVMTDNPVCCLPEDTAGQAARLMRREHLGSIPVISDERSRTLIGIVTDRDLAIKVVAETRDPNHTQIFDVMTRAIIVCRGADDVSTAIKAMREYQIRRVPIVDFDGRIIGIISQGDVTLRIQPPQETVGTVAGVPQAA